MLFSYPFQKHPLSELHKSVRAFIRILHQGDLDPEEFEIDRCCTGELLARAKAGELLEEKLKRFYDAWFCLSDGERTAVRRAFVITNRIRNQVEGTAPRIPLDELSATIKEAAYDLFVHLYEKSLTKTRCKSHWEQFYQALPLKICPFCGVEILHHPDLLKQDYDHLLCKRRYPFASVNLLNLVPCGRDCNQVFKHEKDLIWNEDNGTRRRAYYPFKDYGQAITVSLTGSRLPEQDEDFGGWRVSFLPDTEEVQTWADVFELRRRYRLEVFPAEYDQWREDFLYWVGPQTAPPGGWNVATMRDRMAVYLEDLASERLKDMRFLKHALFEFLLAEAGDHFFSALAAQLTFQPRSIQ